mgnify:CR=1 FL=1
MLTEEELESIKQQLQRHREALQAYLKRAQLIAEGEHYMDVAGSVHSLSDESFAELSTALSYASLGREADTLRDIEEALNRMATHSYGYCVDCGEDISLPRLRIYPTAKRCLRCQQRKEDRHSEKDSTPSL